LVTIENGKCTGCGLCVRICHESCIVVGENSVTIDHAVCSTCGQCIAVCPAQVLSWDGVAPVPFDDRILPASEQMAELLGQRRTVREFKNEKPGRALLEEIAGFGICAPTHNFEMRAIVVDDDNLIAAIDAAVFRFTRNIYFWIFRNRLIGWLARLSGTTMRREFAKARPKLERSLELGRAFKSRPPVVILIVGEKRVPLSLESAQYALYNMNLYAMTRGIACRNLVGNQMILNRNRKLRRKLGVSAKEKIFATMGLGYPAIRFQNKVAGKRMKLSWNGNPSSGESS
jgi:ferredoxin